MIIRVWLILLPLAVSAQDFEALNTVCYEEAKLLFCSRYYSDFWSTCVEKTDISHLNFHRPTSGICVKMHLELCISGDFCIQSQVVAVPMGISTQSPKPYKSPKPKPEPKLFESPEFEGLREDPNIEFKVATDEDSFKEVLNIRVLCVLKLISHRHGTITQFAKQDVLKLTNS